MSTLPTATQNGVLATKPEVTLSQLLDKIQTCGKCFGKQYKMVLQQSNLKLTFSQPRDKIEICAIQKDVSATKPELTLSQLLDKIKICGKCFGKVSSKPCYH
ncbi:uncharacterized protein LOC110455136 [Mizuhopecten yessoensis]|uniref:uncharacterized protein LOC110455136 n=1 Tax=Mizuhopecten yessoensis TaxID=6573 RepID=UPI000B45B04B|nr:uncharacterized protein LOC110455136 [Mizuhopecten yessoensis]